MNIRFNSLIKNRTNARLVGAGLLAAALSATAVGSAVASGQNTTATTADTVVHTAGARQLSTTGGVMTDVLAIDLPAGKFVLSGAGDLVDWGPSDYTRCRIMVGGTQVASVTTMVGNGAAAGANGPASFVSPFSLTGAVILASPATATLQCWHDATVSSSGYVDPNASLTAHKANSLKIAVQ